MPLARSLARIRGSVGRRAGVALFAAVALAAPPALYAAPVSPAPIGGGPTQPIELTERDVAASNQKVGMAFSDLVSMWTNDFAKIGQQFAAPRIARYEDDIMTACGVMEQDNAEYCPRNNTVYYDDVFVAGMEKRAAAALGTDGDMAGLGVIAHEMGHAVAMQLGYDFPTSYQNEATADCLAGSFAQQAQREGSLEPGDLDEAFYGMSMAGDPTPQPTGNVRYDRMVARQIARSSHGTKEQRTENFRAGLDGGPAACLADFRGLK
jgi:hypothetical protein